MRWTRQGLLDLVVLVGVYLLTTACTVLVLEGVRWIVSRIAGPEMGEFAAGCFAVVVLLGGIALVLSGIKDIKKQIRPAASVDDEQDDLD